MSEQENKMNEQELNEQTVETVADEIVDQPAEVQPEGEAVVEAPVEEQAEATDEKPVEEAPTEEQPIGEEAQEATEDAEAEKQQEPPVEEKVEEEVPQEEVVNQPNEEVEKLRSELAEKEAIIKEAEDIKSFERDEAEAQAQYKDFLEKLGTGLAAEFKRYGIDPSKTIEDLEKEDPTKAQVARGLIQQAQNIKQQAQTNLAANLNTRFNQVVFNKASRLFDAFKMTNEEMDVAAETFINIMTETGIRDLDDDLKAKVELAVARAKMIAPKVKEVVEDVKEAIVDVAEAKAEDKVKAEPPVVEENKTQEEEQQQEAKEPETVEETATLDDFKEGVIGKPSASSSINLDNVQQRLAEIKDPRERVKFYVENFALLEEAGKKSIAKEIKKG